MAELKVAVIGAGAAGLYLAWKLGQQRHEVTVFEKKRTIAGKACSGLISERACRLVPGLEKYVENRITSCRINFPRKTVDLRFDPYFVCISRQALNEHLCVLARSAGASIVLNRAIMESNFESELTDRFDRVIGCDGALSVVRRICGLPSPEMKLGIQAFVTAKDFSEHADTWPLKGGFAWRIPRGEETEYGVMGTLRTAHRDFGHLAESLGVKNDLHGLKAALIPQGLCLPDHSRITLCGDSAGLTKPWSGGGILWGFTAAEILLKHFPDFKRYRREARKFFGFKIIKGRLASKWVYFAGRNFPYLLPSAMTYDNDFPVI